MVCLYVFEAFLNILLQILIVQKELLYIGLPFLHTIDLV